VKWQKGLDGNRIPINHYIIVSKLSVTIITIIIKYLDDIIDVVSNTILGMFF